MPVTLLHFCMANWTIGDSPPVRIRSTFSLARRRGAITEFPEKLSTRSFANLKTVRRPVRRYRRPIERATKFILRSLPQPLLVRECKSTRNSVAWPGIKRPAETSGGTARRYEVLSTRRRRRRRRRRHRGGGGGKGTPAPFPCPGALGVR